MLRAIPTFGTSQVEGQEDRTTSPKPAAPLPTASLDASAGMLRLGDTYAEMLNLQAAAYR